MRERKNGDVASGGEGDPAPSEEPMSAAQRSYLRALTEELGEPFEGDLTRGEATARIQALQDEVERLRGERKKG